MNLNDLYERSEDIFDALLDPSTENKEALAREHTRIWEQIHSKERQRDWWPAVGLLLVAISAVSMYAAIWFMITEVVGR